MADTKIDWADKSWNIVTGCSHAGSPGCDHCYARRMAQRLRGRYGYPKDEPFRVTFHADKLNEPAKWKRGQRIFVCSMGDLFHDDVHRDEILHVWHIMTLHPEHTFMVLTKRPEKMLNLLTYWMQPALDISLIDHVWPLPNVWLGVSVENQKALPRIDTLKAIGGVRLFVSLEPLLEELLTIGEHLDGIDLVILGGETGPGARPLNPDWARRIRDACISRRIAFYFKSWGEWLPVGQKPSGEFKPIGKNDALERFYIWEDAERNVSMRVGHKHSGHLLDGREYREMPN